MDTVYLVIEFENRIVYLPFRDLKSVDSFTVGFDNLLELAASINDYLSLGIPNDQILDVYLSEDIDQVNNDMQEFDKRYLSVKFSRDDFIKEDLEKKMINYLKSDINRINLNAGLKKVKDNYQKKYNKELLSDKDIGRITLLYLGDDYKRYKESYYQLKDDGHKVKIREHDINYAKYKEYEEEDKELLVSFTGMSIDELKEYVFSQNKGHVR